MTFKIRVCTTFRCHLRRLWLYMRDIQDTVWQTDKVQCVMQRRIVRAA